MPVRVKVCCIQSVGEARLAVKLGASAVGLVSRMPSGPGVIPESLIAEIAAAVPPGIGSFLLTSLTEPAEIIEQQVRCGANVLQLCDRVSTEAHRQLRAALPGVAIVQVVHVSGDDSVREAVDAAAHVQGLLLDSGNQSLPVKELGGTGRTHDWSLSRKIVESVRVPVFLAGGLTARNVAEAIQGVRPFGVDVCSGLRDASGRLVTGKLRSFMTAVHSQ
jgi:phosphoribosylanthranilate isomerase